MSKWHAYFRRLAGSDDRAAAFSAEQTSLIAASSAPLVDPRFIAEMRTASRGISLGHSVHDPSLGVKIMPGDVAGQGHALVLGATGSGKTYAVAGVIRQLLFELGRGAALGLWVVDHKSELAEIVRRLLAQVLAEIPSTEANRLLDRLVVVNPFSTTALVPLQILRPEPGIAPEVQAFEVTSLVNRLGGAELGVRQDSFLFHLVLLGITRGMTLPEVARLLSEPAALAAAATDSPNAEVRAFFSGAARIANGSLEGVRARLHRLLRLPSSRLMLGAHECVSFSNLLENKIVIADVGSPPLGCEDLGRFWAGLVTLKLTRAIFTRPQHRVRHPVAVMVDEWQEGLAGGGDIADNYERVLTMARSRGVSLWLISQSLAGAARISSSLPKVVSTNTGLQVLFRASAEDAHAMAHLLPVSGRRPRPPVAPWEHAPTSPFLSASEEQRLLIEEVSQLPDRTFYLWNRRRPYPAQLVRAGNVHVPGRRGAGTDHASRVLRDGNLAIPIAELERQTRRASDGEGRAEPQARGEGRASFRLVHGEGEPQAEQLTRRPRRRRRRRN